MPLDSFSSDKHAANFIEETPSTVKKSKQGLMRERQLRIKEFTEMNERLNMMKEQFKKEIMRTSLVVAPSSSMEHQMMMHESQMIMERQQKK